MAQLNLNLSEEFQKDLDTYMKAHGITTKSDAIRMALREAVALLKRKRQTDFNAWIGAATKAPTRKARFESEDDLWKVG